MKPDRNRTVLLRRMPSKETIAACTNKRRREQQNASKHENNRAPERTRKKTHDE